MIRWIIRETRHITTLLLFILVGSVTPTMAQEHLPYGDVVGALESPSTRVERATVWIEIRGPNNTSLGTGSGVLVSPQGYILTAHHVLKEYYKDPTNIRIFVKRVGSDMTLQSENLARLIGSDPNVDMALLHLPGNNMPFLKVGRSSSLSTDASLTAYGFGVGSFDVLHKSGQRSGSTWEVDIPVSAGFSGGPVVVKGCDVLVGIVSAGLEDSSGRLITGRNQIIPSQYGADLLKKADSTESHSLCSEVSQSTRAEIKTKQRSNSITKRNMLDHAEALIQTCDQSRGKLKRPLGIFIPQWLSTLDRLRSEEWTPDLETLFRIWGEGRCLSGSTCQDQFEEAIFTLKCLESSGLVKLENLKSDSLYHGVNFKNQRISF